MANLAELILAAEYFSEASGDMQQWFCKALASMVVVVSHRHPAASTATFLLEFLAWRPMVCAGAYLVKLEACLLVSKAELW